MTRDTMGRPSMKRRILATRASILAGALAITLSAPGPALAHFLWLTCEPEQGKPVVRAFLSETPIPEGPEFLKHIADSKITASGKVLGWTKDQETYRVNLPEPCPGVIDGSCDLGVMNRGGATFRLIYTARDLLGPPSVTTADASGHLRLKLVPARPLLWR
jgi:hypothetical protein